MADDKREPEIVECRSVVVEGGYISVRYPKVMTTESIDDFEYMLELIIRQLRRRASEQKGA